MSTQHWKGVTIPAEGDDLLESWGQFVDTAGIYIPAATQAAARVMISQAVTTNAAIITPTQPAVFFINGVFFWADGTKDTAGAYKLTPANVYSGILHRTQDTYNGLGAAASDLYVEGEGTITLPLDTVVEFYLEACISGESDATGSVVSGFRVDGADIYKSEIAYTKYYETHTIRWVEELTAGSHTVAYTTQKRSGATPFYHYSDGAYPGRRFTVTQLGITA